MVAGGAAASSIPRRPQSPPALSREVTAGLRRPTRAVISGGAFRPFPIPSFTPDEEPSAVFESLFTIRTPDAKSKRAQAAYEALNLYKGMRKLARQSPSADVATLWLTRSTIDLAELAAFQSKWHLRCPVPPYA